MKLDELPRDAQAEAGSVMFPRQGSVRLFEGFEDAVEFVFGNADARIGNGDFDHTVIRHRGNGHLAGLGKFDSVAHKVVQDLLDSVFIAVDGGGILGDCIVQRQVLILDKRHR